MPDGPATPICGRKLEEVGIVELDVEISPVMITVLDVLDRAVGRVVVDERDHPQAVSYGRGELLGGHQEAAVAADRDAPGRRRARPRRRPPPESAQPSVM